MKTTNNNFKLNGNFMKKITLMILALTLITACSSAKLTPEEREEMQKRAEQIHGARA